MTCPKCGSDNIESTVFQENVGGKSVTKTKSKYKEKGHGFVWWLFVGSWWWIVDLLTWIFTFIPRVLLSPYKKDKGKGKERSVTKTNNKIKYKTIHLCEDCGYRW